MIHFSGHLRLGAASRADGRTVVADQSFRAPFHLSKPYWDDEARTLLVQVVNPTAGILSGDQLTSEIGVGPGASLLVTTPSASRVFTMTEGLAECRQSFRVAASGWLEVLPEPLVPHRASRFHQSTAIEVEPGGALFYVDQLMPGRLGHGEAWSWEKLCLVLELRMAGELIVRERFAHSGADLRALAEYSGSGPTACFANAVVASPALAAADWTRELATLHRDGVWIGASALRQGGWTIKIVAADPIRMRATLREVRALLGKRIPGLRADTRKL